MDTLVELAANELERDRVLILALLRQDVVQPNAVNWEFFGRIKSLKERNSQLGSMMAARFRRDPAATHTLIDSLAFLSPDERMSLREALVQAAREKR
jgi:hypothetical protein